MSNLPKHLVPPPVRRPSPMWVLTNGIIQNRMKPIRVGDVIRFDSMKECYTADQVDRHSSTIKANGTVVENCGGYVLVRLRNGLTESVNYFDIQSVNGHSFPGYIRRISLVESRPQEYTSWL